MRIIPPFKEYIKIYEKKYWGSKGAGILPYCPKTKRFLIALRSDYVNEPNTYGVFGGALDGGEDFEKGALREMEEELGYIGKVELKHISTYIDGSFTYMTYLGIVPDEFEFTLDWENEEAIWLTYDEILDLYPKHFGLVYTLENSKIKLSEL